ncbi:MAG: hypothetical protein VX599_04260 [Pseudomonadota bacterium]|nr:hypothetical protein [Pseudomonadota bacterium]
MSETPAAPAPQPAATPAEPQPSITTSDAFNQLSEIKVYTHSPILYWWPIWALGLIFGFVSLFVSGEGTEAAARVQGQTFVFVLVFVIFSTTVKLRGANSVILGLILLIGGILLATANLSGPIAAFIGGLDIRMSPAFYWFVGISVFVMWAVMIFGFDKVKFYEIAPGQVRERVFWGSGDRAESGANARCRYLKDDFLRHRILGVVVTGDIEITLADGEVWYLHNVLFAKEKANRINELIVTRPVD